MQWEFTPEDVAKARSDYGLQEFRRDLAEEVRMNLEDAAEHQHERVFNLVYDMCHALATGKDFEGFLGAYAYDPPTCEFLRGLQPVMADNVRMLGAILQRMIMDGIAAGLPLEQAVNQAASRHAELVAHC